MPPRPDPEDKFAEGSLAVDEVTLTETQAYVYWVYWDLFGRDPDAAGLAHWTQKLESGTPRRAVADSLTASSEFRAWYIAWGYQGYLDRTSDAQGTATWLEQMRKGLTIQQVHAKLIASTEFYVKAGGTDSGFIQSLYGRALGRTPAEAEVTFWVNRMKSGVSRYQIALGFLMSTERLRFDINEEYKWFLGRAADPSGLTTWVRQIQSGVRYEQVIGSIIASAEYMNLIRKWLEPK